MARKAFTVDEANAMIPQLEDIMSGLRDRMTRLEQYHERLQLLDVLWGEKIRHPSNPDHLEYQELQAGVRGCARQIREIVQREIAGRGLRFPAGGLEHGLLDFPTTYQGRWVFLCWRSGEKRISAWHEVDGGFAGRQPLTADQARRMGREDDPAHVDDSMLDF